MFKLRHEIDPGAYTPELLALATLEEVEQALKVVALKLNQGAHVTSMYGLKDAKLSFGSTEFRSIRRGAHLWLGLWGEYPVANLALLLGNPGRTGSAGFGECLGSTFDKGTRFFFAHCSWADRPWKHDLPMRDDWYRAIRRTAAAHLEEALRQMGL